MNSRLGISAFIIAVIGCILASSSFIMILTNPNEVKTEKIVIIPDNSVFCQLVEVSKTDLNETIALSSIDQPEYIFDNDSELVGFDFAFEHLEMDVYIEEPPSFWKVLLEVYLPSVVYSYSKSILVSAEIQGDTISQPKESFEPSILVSHYHYSVLDISNKLWQDDVPSEISVRVVIGFR